MSEERSKEGERQIPGYSVELPGRRIWVGYDKEDHRGPTVCIRIARGIGTTKVTRTELDMSVEGAIALAACLHEALVKEALFAVSANPEGGGRELDAESKALNEAYDAT